MSLWILRSVFLLVAAGVGVSLVNSDMMEGVSSWITVLAFIAVVLLALTVIAVDILVPRKRIDIISTVYFGVVVGLFLTYVAGLAMAPLLPSGGTQAQTQSFVRLLVGMILCYTCISLLMQTKDDFRFIIPYVEFAKEVKGLRPYLLDTSVIIDGRIADLLETGIFDNQLIMPRFILSELQGVADSNDRLRRARGRRGLDVLNTLRGNENVELKIYDRELPEMEGQTVDMKLVLLAKHLEGKVVTGDYNLNKVAKLHNVPVINLNDVSNALKPVFLPGENLLVRIVKAGEEAGQGVGYLDDGTMIVIESGRDHVGKTVEVSVTSVLQTSAGRMIFGKYEKETVGKGA